MSTKQQTELILPLVKKMFVRLGMQNDPISLISLQGGNNRVYKVIAGKAEYVLKYYFRSDKDKRDRFQTEILFWDYTKQIKTIHVPDLILSDKKNGLALFEYIKGRKLNKGEVKKVYVTQALEFIEAINMARLEKIENQLLNASEACFSVEDYMNTVEKRVAALNNIEPVDDINRAAEKFVQTWLVPKWETIAKTLNSLPGKNKVIGKNEQIISPSDFGFHNAICKDGNEICFFDFEYAGWDDPVKMICDFFCQPEIPVPEKYFEYFIAGMIKILNPAYDLRGKVKLLMPLHRLKWCCIMLNEFLIKNNQRKRFAFSYKDRREGQLKKVVEYARIHQV